MALAKTLTTPRTDQQVFGHESIKVELAGQTYEIKPTTKTRAKEFRAAIGKHKQFIRRAVELFRLANTKDVKVSAEEIADVLVMAYSELLDKAYELVYIYCPNIEADRDKLDDRDEGATDHEWQNALWTVLKITSGPFTRALGLSSGDGAGLLEKLSALGVEYQRRQPAESPSVISESILGTETEKKVSDTPVSQPNGESSPEKSTIS